VGRLPVLHRLLVDGFEEVPTLDIAHGVEELASLLARLVDGHDMFVLEARRQLRFEAEPALGRGIVELGCLDDLQCYRPPHLGVEGPVHHPHPAFADQADQLVRP
jgi:hypothetical protein